MEDETFDYVSPPAKIIETLHLMRWRPIETAPKDGNCVLLWFAAEGCTPWADVCYWEDEWGKDKDGTWVLSCECEHSCARPQGYYTHWMPMPSAPALT